MTLSPEQVAHITAQVRAQLPDIEGAPASITPQPADAAPARFLLCYQHTALTANGRRLRRVVRVVADAHGHILKLSVSR